jgi:hypothetical protein
VLGKLNPELENFEEMGWGGRRLVLVAKKNNKYLTIKITFSYVINNNTSFKTLKCWVGTWQDGRLSLEGIPG